MIHLQSNFEDLLAGVKRAAIEAVNAAKPFALAYGTVAEESPLQITVDQKLTLYAGQLILTAPVCDHKVDITVDGEQKQVTVHSALKVGERVLLLRANGGQKYIVLDRAEVLS